MEIRRFVLAFFLAVRLLNPDFLFRVFLFSGVVLVLFLQHVLFLFIFYAATFSYAAYNLSD